MTVSGSVNTFEETGFDHEIDLGVASAGAENTIHDVDNEHGIIIEPDPTGTELDISVS